MTNYRQVIFTTNDSAGSRVTKIGYLREDPKREDQCIYCKRTAKFVIDKINHETEDWEFFTYVDGVKAVLEVAERKGVPYLKTEKDTDKPNNLLSLPSCPSVYFDE